MFSKEQTQIYDLALDLSRCDFSAHIDGDEVTKKDLENHLRDRINKDIFYKFFRCKGRKPEKIR